MIKARELDNNPVTTVQFLLRECRGYQQHLRSCLPSKLVGPSGNIGYLFDGLETAPECAVAQGINKMKAIHGNFSGLSAADQDAYTRICAKYNAVCDLVKTLLEDTTDNSTLTPAQAKKNLGKFKSQFDDVKETIGLHRDKPSMRFLKVVGQVLTLFLPSIIQYGNLSIFRSKGKQVASQMEARLKHGGFAPAA